MEVDLTENVGDVTMLPKAALLCMREVEDLQFLLARNIKFITLEAITHPLLSSSGIGRNQNSCSLGR
jgi:hypothetical protein